MAIRTFVHSKYADGLVRLEFDYNDGNENVIRFRCVNDSDYELYGEALRVDPATEVETLLRSGLFGAHTTTERTVANFKLKMVDNRIDMGNYQIRARWPAE